MKTTLKVIVDFKIADIVFIKTDPDQVPHIVTGIILKEKDTLYQVTQYSETFNFYGYELSEEPDVLLRLEGGRKQNDFEIE